MAYVVAFIGAVCLVNLFLTFVVVRRLRQHGEQLAALPRFRPPPRLPAGSQAPDFMTTTVTGATRSLAGLAGSRGLVGFFNPDCGPCRKQLPEFADLARTMPGGAEQVLAVVSGDEATAAGMTSELNGLASVVIEPGEGPMCRAFSVRGFPSFYVIGADGRIEGSGEAVRMLATR